MGYLQEQAEREWTSTVRPSRCWAVRSAKQYTIEHGPADNRFHDGEPSDYHDYELDMSHSFILRYLINVLIARSARACLS